MSDPSAFDTTTANGSPSATRPQSHHPSESARPFATRMLAEEYTSTAASATGAPVVSDVVQTPTFPSATRTLSPRSVTTTRR